MPRIPHIRRPQRNQPTGTQPQPAAAKFSLFPEMGYFPKQENNDFQETRRRRRAPAPPPISPQEESDWLGNTMGAAQYIGETLDKGGAAARGLIGGQGPKALLNLIPFSDTLGVTDPKERIYGEDLLEQWGVVGPKSREGIDWGRTLAGLGVDILTDPLTLVGGPLSKTATSAAKAAKLARSASKAVDAVPLLKEIPELLKAGKVADVVSHTPTTLSAALRTGEAPIATLHAPFWAEWLGASKEPWLEFGAKSGKVGQVAAKATAATNDILAYHTPVKYLRGLLSPAATGALSKQGSTSTFDTAQQILNDLNYSTRKQLAGAADNLVVSAGKASDDLQRRFGELAEHFKEAGDIQSYQEFSKRMVTDPAGIPDPSALHQQLLETFHVPVNTTPEAMEQTSELARRMYESFTPLREAMDYQHNLLRELGHPTKNLQDIYASYWPRGSSEARMEDTMRRLLNLREGLPEDTIRSDIARKDYFRNVPGADSTIDALAKNPAFSGFEVAEDGIYQPLSKAEHIEALQASLNRPNVNDLDQLRTEYLRKHIAPKLEAAWPDKNEVRKLINAEGKEVQFTYADELAAWMDDDTRAKNLIDALGDMSPRARKAAIEKKMAGASKATRDQLQKEIDAIGGGIWEKGVFDGDPIEDAMRNMRYMLDQEATMRATHNFLAQPKMVRSAADLPDGAMLRKVWKDVGFEENGLKKFVLDNADSFGYDARALMADDKAMEAAINNLHLTPGAEGALLSYNQLTQPRVESAVIKLFDRVSTVYKSLLYNIWPASHIRDSISDFWQAGSMGYVPLFSTGKGGGLINSTVNAAKYIQSGVVPELLEEYKALGMGLSPDMIDALRSFSAAKRLTKIPEPGSGLLKGVFGEGWKAGVKNPFKMPGFMAVEKVGEGVPMNKAMEIANRVQNVKHFISQYGYYEALRKRGFSPAQAKHLIEKTFFTAKEQSKFARDVASRGVLFWRFASNNIPFQLRKLAEQPGGIAAQTIRGVTELSAQQNHDVYTPRFLQETQTIPVGATDPNAQSFFRNSIFPINDFNDIVMRGNMPDIKRTAMKALARLHPLALAGPEMLSNTQFATGRKISDLESFTGKLGKEIPFIDRLLHYAPISRMQSEALSFSDPRKNIWQHLSNFAGSGSVSTYDTEKWKNLDYREALAKFLEDNTDVSQWTSYYVPNSRKENMTPEEIERVKMLIKRHGQITKRPQQMRKATQQSKKK